MTQPITRQFFERLDAAGGLDFVEAEIIDGKTQAQIAIQFSVSSNLLSRYIISRDGQERMAKARRERARRMAEETLEIADNVAQNRDAINKAKLRIEARQWLAAKDDPSTFGMPKSNVTINIGELHLDALRQVQMEERQRLSDPRVIDGEIVGRSE